jgi:IS5 family transposase
MNNKQGTFSDAEYANRKRKGKRAEFLEKMERIIPWEAVIGVIEPHYESKKLGRPRCPLMVMLRMYLLQIWFNLSDEGTEDAIYDSRAMKEFTGIDFAEEDVPDATTLLHFRHFLEGKRLQKAIFDKINERMEEEGVLLRGGSIVDATFVEAPSSTKNSAKSRDPEMKQAKKGNNRHFGMKAHIGVDAYSGAVHTVEATAANVSDIEVAHKLIREDDEVANLDAGYVGIEKRKEIVGDAHLSEVEYRVNSRKGPKRERDGKIYKNALEHLEYIGGGDWDAEAERQKSKVRSKVEHAFQIMKVRFGRRKTRYRGIEKNWMMLYMVFASVNLLKWAWSREEARRPKRRW